MEIMGFCQTKIPGKSRDFFVQSLSMRKKIVDKTFSIWIMTSTTTHTTNRPATAGPSPGGGVAQDARREGGMQSRT